MPQETPTIRGTRLAATPPRPTFRPYTYRGHEHEQPRQEEQ